MFFFGGAFFMSFWFGRDTRVLLVCLLLRKKGRFRYRSWIRRNDNISKLFLRFFVSLFPPLFFFKLYSKTPPLSYPVVSSFLWGLLSHVMLMNDTKERKKERKKKRERERDTERFFYDASI